MQKEIVLATDFLEHSDAAKNAAIQFAKATGAALNLVHVCDDGIEAQAMWATAWGGAQAWATVVFDRMQHQATANLASYSKTFPTDATVKTTMLVGNPARALNEFIKNKNEEVSLVMLSKRRRSYFNEYFLGSVVYKVVQQCMRPIFVMPDDIDFSQWQPKHIVVAMSLADGTHHALKTAAILAKSFGSKVTLIHTIEAEPVSTKKNSTMWNSFLGQDELKAFHAEYFVKNELERLAKEVHLDESTQIEVQFGSVIETLSNAMADLKGDLLITGSHSTRGAKRVLMGSIPSTLAHSARFPLLVVQHDDLTQILEPSA